MMSGYLAGQSFGGGGGGGGGVVLVGGGGSLLVVLGCPGMSEVASGGASVGGGAQVDFRTEDWKERGMPVVEGRPSRGLSGNF